MSGSIRLSKEFGVNPSIASCYYCGESTNEIILFGAGYKDPKTGRSAQAPMRGPAISLEPCPKCRETYKDYYFLVESIDGRSPSGDYILLKKEVWTKIFNVPIPPKGIAFIDPEGMAKIKGMMPKGDS